MYAVHQLVWDLFQDPEHGPRDFLYRHDRDPERVHILSKRAPVQAPEGWRLDTKPYELMLEVGTRLRFLVRANAVRSRSIQKEQPPQRGRPKKTVRHDVVLHRALREGLFDELEHGSGQRTALWRRIADEEGSAWLAEQGQRNGFEVEEAWCQEHRRHVVRSKGGLRFRSLDLTGHLLVMDPSKFRECLAEGIGKSRAFGCGLLMVRRP